MDPFAHKDAVVEILPPPQPGSREAAYLAALQHAARDMERHLATCETAANEAAIDDTLSVRINLAGAPADPQAFALALSVAGGVLDALAAHISSPGLSVE